MANVSFYVDTTSSAKKSNTEGAITFNTYSTKSAIYYGTGSSYTEVANKTSVSGTLTSGTKIGTIQYGSSSKDLYNGVNFGFTSGFKTTYKLSDIIASYNPCIMWLEITAAKKYVSGERSTNQAASFTTQVFPIFRINSETNSADKIYVGEYTATVDSALVTAHLKFRSATLLDVYFDTATVSGSTLSVSSYTYNSGTTLVTKLLEGLKVISFSNF